MRSTESNPIEVDCERVEIETKMVSFPGSFLVLRRIYAKNINGIK